MSLARKIAGPARSSGTPSLPSGTRLDMSALLVGFDRSSLLILVSIVPVNKAQDNDKKPGRELGRLMIYTGKGRR